MGDDSYETIGGCLAALCSVPVFIGAWWYCVATYGFLFGFGLGWLPAGILAGIVALVVRWLWPIVLLGIALLAAQVMK